MQDARDDALAAERIRQNRLDQEAAALNVQSQDRYQDFDTKQDETASKLGDLFTEQQAEATDANAAAAVQQLMPQSDSNITVRNEEQQRGAARAFTNQQGEALGELRSFDNLMGSIGREQARDAGAIGQIGGFKRGSSGIVPLELEAANSAGNGAKFIGDILGMAGSVAFNKGISGSYVSPGAASDPWAGMRKPSGGGLFSLFR